MFSVVGVCGIKPFVSLREIRVGDITVPFGLWRTTMFLPILIHGEEGGTMEA